MGEEKKEVDVENLHIRPIFIHYWEAVIKGRVDEYKDYARPMPIKSHQIKS